MRATWVGMFLGGWAVLGWSLACSPQKDSPSNDAGTFADGGGVPDGGVADAGPPPALVHIDWCDAGCPLHAGMDDARTNTSSLVSSDVVLSPSTTTLSDRAQILTCVRGYFAPYNIAFTETDPGKVPHRKVAAGGTSEQIGLPSGVLADAPLTCHDETEAVAFAFTNSVPAQVDALCTAIAQDVALTLGLEPVFYCPDVMSQLTGCGTKRFTHDAAPCGTTAAAACQCGGTTQNSDAKLSAALGPSH